MCKQFSIEASYNAEIVAATFECAKEVGVGSTAGGCDGAVGKDDLVFHDVVTGEAVAARVEGDAAWKMLDWMDVYWEEGLRTSCY